MDINIYQKYKVKITSEGSTKTYEGFERFNVTNTYEEDGGKLLEWIAKELMENDVQSMKMTNDTITIEHFDPLTGEGGKTIYETKVIE